MKRNQQLDFFRGLLLIIITLDHALLFNNIIRRFTYEFIGWFSAAEGFVFLSGLTAGIVYTHKATEKGTGFISGLAIKRALTIYRNHLALLLFICAATLGSPFIGEHWSSAYAPLMKQPLLAFIKGILLVYQPPFLDILPMYIVFLLLVPFSIKWFQKGHAGYVLLGSCTLYLVSSINELFNFFPLSFQSLPLNNRPFNLQCWQILFLLGLFAGFTSQKGQAKHWQTSKQLFYSALFISITLFLLKNTHAELSWLHLSYATDKTNLGPLRLLNFLAIGYAFIFIASKQEHWFTYKPICYLGKYSLEVFSFHIVLLILLLPIKMWFNSIYIIKITQNFYFYPFGTLFVFLGIIPLLFLAPTLLGKTKKISSPCLRKQPIAH